MTKKYFDLSAYNSTSDWKRIELPYRKIAEGPEFYIFLAICLTLVSIPLCLFLIIQICRFSHRRTAINGLIVASSTCSLLSLSHSILILLNNYTLCHSTFVIFPTLLLFQKLLLTSMAVTRHTYVLCKSLIYQNSSATLMFVGTFSTAFVVSFIPCMTLLHEAHPLWNSCLLIHDNEDSAKYSFLLAFFIILCNSLLVDVICYSRILNFMRKNSMRVTVIATTPGERSKAHNIVTATSSFLIWLVNIVAMIPSSILLIRSSASLNAQHINTLVNFQVATIWAFCVVNPLLYILSSADLRKDFDVFKRHLTGNEMTIGDQPPRSDVYAIQVVMESRQGSVF